MHWPASETPSQRRFAGGPIVAWDRVMAGFGLHVGQIKLRAFIYLFLSGIVEQLFFVYLFVYKHTRKSNQKNMYQIFDSVALKG